MFPVWPGLELLAAAGVLEGKSCSAYRAIAPDLFNRIVMSAFRSDEISQFVCSQSQRVDK